MKTKKIFILYLGLSFMLLFSFSACKKAKTNSKSFDKENIAFPVELGKVERGFISEYKIYPGITKSYNTKVILPEVAGRIKRMLRNVGEKVQKGEILFKLEDTLYRSQYEQAKSAFELSKIQLKDVEKNYKRLKNVYKKNGISKAEFERAESAYYMAKENLKRAEAALRAAKFQFVNTKVKAPFSGVITGKFKEEGDFINPQMGGFSQTAGVYMLESFEKLYVDLDVPEKDINLFKVGMKADVISGDKKIEGKILYLNKKVDPFSSSISIRVIAENSNSLVLPGSIVKVKLHYREKENTLFVKRAALIDNYVFKVVNNIAKKIKVKVGIMNDDFVEILSGLKEGDRVIVSGNYGLFDGAIVKEEKK